MRLTYNMLYNVLEDWNDSKSYASRLFSWVGVEESDLIKSFRSFVQNLSRGREDILLKNNEIFDLFYLLARRTQDPNFKGLCFSFRRNIYQEDCDCFCTLLRSSRTLLIAGKLTQENFQKEFNALTSEENEVRIILK